MKKCAVLQIRRFVAALFSFAALTVLSGCRSAFIEATVVNRTGQVVRLLEVDYPNASFGTQDLLPGAVYHYRFKVLGSGVVRASWTDAGQKDHTSTGPKLSEGDQGDLSIALGSDEAQWQPALHR